MFTLYIKPMIKEVEIPKGAFDETLRLFHFKEIKHLPLYNGKPNAMEMNKALFRDWINLDPYYSDKILAVTYWEEDNDDMFPHLGVQPNITSVLSFWPFADMAFNENGNIAKMVAHGNHEIAHGFVGACTTEEPCITKCDTSKNLDCNVYDLEFSSHELCEECKQYIDYKNEVVGDVPVAESDIERIRNFIFSESII